MNETRDQVSSELPDPILIDRLLTAVPSATTTLEAELLRRAANPQRRASLRCYLLARTQEADEYLGASAGVARHYLSFLDVLPAETETPVG